MNKTDVINIIKEKLQILVNFYSTKNYKEVISKGLPLLKKNPQLNVLTNLVSLSYHNLGEHDKALNYLNKAFQVNSNDKSVLNNLGLIYTSIEKYEEAEEYLTRALKLHSDYIPAKINLANLKLKLNNATESINILEKILIKDKNNYDANFTLGNAYQQAGEFKKAEECFNKCLLLDKTKTIADKSLSLIIKYNKDSKHLKHMKEKINLKKTFDMESLSHLNFAIGKAYEDIGKYKEAFYHLDRGNKIKKTLIKYNFLEEKKLFINIKKLFSHFTYENHIDNDDNKIFVVGMTRSGTSLIEQILSSHNNIYGAGELNYIQNIASQHFMKNEIEFTESNINNYKEDIFFKSKIYYNNNLKRFKTNKKFIVDKAPLNFKWIGLILKLFPGCKIIHCTRDPMDICWSNYKNFFSSIKMNYANNFKNIAYFYNLYLDIMNYWQNKFEKEIYDIDYENLIKNPEKEIKNLVSFCGLDWNENYLKFYENKKTVSTASLAQVRSPLYKSSIKKWEKFSEKLNELKKLINY